MRNKAFEKLLKEAILLDAEEQGAHMDASNEPIPEAAQARFDAALNGKRKEPKRMIAVASSEQPQPVKRAHRWLAYGLTAVSAAAVILIVALLVGTGGLRGTKPQEPVMPAEQQPMQAETTMEPLPEPGGGSSFGPAFILNGKELDVYTEHYFIAGTDDDIPLNAFLSSIGSYYVDSPYNKYQVQCYEIEGIRYIYDWESQVFALAEQYDSVVQAAKTKGRMPTEAEFQTIDLLPAEVEMQAEAWLDHSTLESVLRKMGLDITIELDREENAIRVTMSEPEAAAVPDDPERPDLHLLAMKWEGYLCLYPETHQVFWSDERELDTGELVGLDELTYQKVAETEIVGTDLSVWNAEDYSTFADSNVGGGFSTADELEEVRRTEIVPGVTCLHLHHPTNEYYLSYAVLDYDGTDALFLIGVSYDASGIDDFDSIVKRFFSMNPAEPVEIRAEDLEGVWREWTPDNVDVGYRLTLFRDGTAKMVYQIPLSGEQTIEGTYSVKNGITVTFGDETMQAVYDPESDALLLFESETSWLTLYRNPDTYMLEHWFEMQRKPLLKKTVAMEDLFGVWTLERAESAFSSFDLSGLSGYLSIEQGSFRIGMRLAGEDHSASLACSVIDSVLTETGNSNGKIIAILDPYTNELKLCTLVYERELTEADPVLVFRKLSNAEQTMTQDALVGTWSEIKSLVGTWTMIDPTLSAQGYTLELVFESDEKVALNVSQSGKTSSVAFTYIITDNDVHLYMESYEVYPDGSIVKEKQEYYLFVSDGVMTYDVETDTLFVPNDEGGQTRFIRQAD